jgi:diguanylate cyclase (GGDEF)-like protein
MGEILRSRIPRQLWRAGAAFAVVMGLTVGAYFMLGSPHVRLYFLDLVPPLVGLLVSALLLGGSWWIQRRAAPLAVTWRWIGLAVLLYTFGDVAWAVFQLSTGAAVFPSLADAFYLLYYPLFFVGLVRAAPGGVSRLGGLNLGLDLLTLFVAGSLVVWNLLIGPFVFSAAGRPFLNQVILWAYVIGDLELLGTMILILYYQRDEMEIASSLILGAALLVMLVTDVVYAYRTLAGTYESARLTNAGWTGAHVLTALAFLPQLLSWSQPNPPVRKTADASYLSFQRTLRTYLPYGALLLAYVLLRRGGLAALPMSPLTLGLGLGAIVALVLLRQITTLSENAELTAQLVSKADELEHSNRYLAVEVTERRRIEEKLSYDTLHDPMTGLPNRGLFLNMLSHAISLSRGRKRHSYAVLFIDIDHFKVVNDSLGHMVGDQLLWAIGARLKGTLRSTDTLARFGGDEFAILMDVPAHEDSANTLADRVQRSLQQAFRIEGHELHMSASIGIVSDVSNYEQAEDLLRDADLAMYEAKSMGKSRFQAFAVRMRKRAFLRLDMETELRKGLGSGEIQVYYQPIISLKTDRVAGMEALVRWQHPTRGLLRPKDFLSVAEESGLILRMGEQVLAAACSEMNRLQEQHRGLGELGVSVNVSNKQFTQPGLITAVALALRRTGLQPRALKLEITEKVLIDNLRLANRVFNELNAMGVRIDIDDFGTGYSALTYLQNFPIHALKIDQGFIEGMRKSRKGLGLVRAIVAMAHELGMETVAEGITSKAQLNDLKALQCDYGQGLLVSRPLRDRAIEAYLEQHFMNGARLKTNAAARRKPARKVAAVDED